MTWNWFRDNLHEPDMHIELLTAVVTHWRRSSVNNTAHIERIRGVSLATMRCINRQWHWRCSTQEISKIGLRLNVLLILDSFWIQDMDDFDNISVGWTGSGWREYKHILHLARCVSAGRDRTSADTHGCVNSSSVGNVILFSPGVHGCWRRSIVVRTLVSAGELSLSCARLLAGWVTTLWLSG